MIISIYRCCGPQKIEKILINHKKKKNVNTKCDFRQFRLNSKSYNFAFCVFFVFLTDRKCRPLSSFSKSGGFGWVRNVIYERQNLTEVVGFWFQLWAQSGPGFCSRIGGVPFVLPVGWANGCCCIVIRASAARWACFWNRGKRLSMFSRHCSVFPYFETQRVAT